MITALEALQTLAARRVAEAIEANRSVVGCRDINMGGPINIMGGDKVPKVTSHQLAAIDQILATLPLASIAFKTPATLHLGHSEVIQLFLSMQHSIEQLQAKIRAVGEREGAYIRVSHLMESRLTG